jgi:chemotaxis protein methyltransferase CheR
MNRAFTELEFLDIIQAAYLHAGLSLGPAKQVMVQNRLNKLQKVLNCNSIDALLKQIDRDAVVRQAFVNCLTTNVTHFYREAQHFKTLEMALRERYAKTPQGVFPLVWSAGCSTGQEAISILFTMLDALGPSAQNAGRPLVYATDIDTDALDLAKRGVYAAKLVHAIPSRWLQTAFDPDPMNGTYSLKPAFRVLIAYQSLNLASDQWSIPPALSAMGFDAIFCRNVMIYFSAQTQREVLDRLICKLKPTGFLFSGHCEMLLHCEDLLVSLGSTTYQPVKKTMSMALAR